MPLPPLPFLYDVYRHLPFLVLHITTDGTVLHCNPETSRVTGYTEPELLGTNVWGLLFPGKLFAQVPRFISLVHPSPLLKDVPMTIRTKSGRERVIAFSRYFHTEQPSDGRPSDSAAPRSFICIGVDLTDRLLNADLVELQPGMAPQLPPITGAFEFPPLDADDTVPGTFGPHIGNAGAIDGEFVTPIAISPKAPRNDLPPGHSPVDQVREGLARVETHMACVQAALAEGELHTLSIFQNGMHVLAGSASFEAMARGEWLYPQIAGKPMAAMKMRVDELLTIYRPEPA